MRIELNAMISKMFLQNVSPAYAPDVVVFIDSIMVVFDKVSSSGPPLPLPVTCTESGNDYSLPNLALRFLSASHLKFEFLHLVDDQTYSQHLMSNLMISSSFYLNFLQER